MESLISLATKTEFSFKECFAPIDLIVDNCDQDQMGIADKNNTLGHVFFAKACERKGIRPIFGVRLDVCDLIEKQRSANNSFTTRTEMIFLAKNESGLREIYELTSLAWDSFYYFPRVSTEPILRLSKDVLVLAYTLPLGLEKLSPRVDYVALAVGFSPDRTLSDKPAVAIQNNRYPEPSDKEIYQLLAGARKHGRGYNYLFNDQTYPQHYLTDEEFTNEFAYTSRAYEAIWNSHVIAGQCVATIPSAEMVKYSGSQTIISCCLEGARKKKIDLDDFTYGNRFKYELDLIKQKGYEDYFLIVSDMIRYAKQTMLVGPSRGSSAGSLVCYLMDITEIDPIKHGLLFERFIDINRHDLPDIDVDFPDKKREKVIKYLSHKYGHKNVRTLANVNRLKPKSAIGEFAQSLGIPAYETEELKNAIIERSGGDARAAMCIADTFDSTDIGKSFIADHPKMALVSKVENHASHAGRHAAGVLVSTEALNNYAATNSRDDIVMLDKKSAEMLGLLKIDCLGLRTLTLLEETMDQIGWTYEKLYQLSLEDEKTFELFQKGRFNGIFQFEGQALQLLAKQMGVHKFDDIVAITALVRPGPLHSGGSGRFVKRRTGESEVEYISNDDVYIKHTQETLGIIIYQEQLMYIGKEYGGLSWEDVSDLRRAASKSLGEEFFNKYKDKFLEGASKRGRSKEEATEVWENMVTFGSWGFNKSHAVSYGLISYWTAYMKANYPLEFAVATLNNSATPENAIKFLRDLVVNEGYEYVPVDPDTSQINWSVQDGKLVGGLINIEGIGESKAKDILRIREGKKKMTPGLMKKLMNPITKFDIIFPTQHYWGQLYDDPRSYGLVNPPDHIADIDQPGIYTIVGRLTMRDLRDLNDYNEVMKRGGKVYEYNTHYLRLMLEDDTGQILTVISRWDFDEMEGQHIAETAIEGETWFLVKGKKKGDWHKLDIISIFNLTQWKKDNDSKQMSNM